MHSYSITDLEAERALEAPVSVPQGGHVLGMGACWRVQPAAPGAGGDWVDFVDAGPGRLAISVGDAAGHDDKAAAFARCVRQALRNRLLDGAGPDVAVRGAVHDLAGLDDLGEMFATAFVAVGRRHLCQRRAPAGHPPALDPAPDKRRNSAAQRYLGPTGPIMSDLFAGTSLWSTRSLTMAIGDKLLIYTDSISEARNAVGHQFGTRIPATGHEGDRSPETLITQLFADVEAHVRGASSDDRSAAVLARRPSPVAHEP